jgi:hypothetical protein
MAPPPPPSDHGGGPVRLPAHHLHRVLLLRGGCPVDFFTASRRPCFRFQFFLEQKKKLFFASRVVFALDSSPPAPSSMYPSSLAYLYLVKCLVSRDCYDYPPEIVMALHLMPTVSGAPLRWIRGSNVPVLLDCTDSTQGSAGSVILT